MRVSDISEIKKLSTPEKILLTPFGRWTLRENTAQRRLALRWILEADLTK
jgi:hypothetical protein